MFGDEETTPKPDYQSINIDPEILSSLGLNPQDVEQYDAEVKAWQKELANIEQQGNQYYATKLQGELTSGRQVIWIGKSGNLQLNIRHANELPDALIKERQAILHIHPQARNPKEDAKFQEAMKRFIKGYGTAALESGDWQTAINAFDIVTEDGILQNQEVMTQLRDLSQADKVAGVDIAKAIQERVNRRKQGEETPPPQSPGSTPESELRSAPQPPSPTLPSPEVQESL